MMNKRISKSDKLAALAKDRYRVVYFMIYPHLDREGRYSGDPRDIKEDCIPRLRYSIAQISESLAALRDVGLIMLYEVGGKQYLEATRFDDFQVGLHKERESASEIPPYPGPNPDNSGELRSSAEKVPLNLNVNVKFKEKVKGKPPALPLPDSPEFLEFQKEAISTIEEIFKKNGFDELLKEKRFFDYLLLLCWEYRALDLGDELEGKLAHLRDKPLGPKSNVCLQFKNWFRNGARYQEERARDFRVGKR